MVPRAKKSARRGADRTARVRKRSEKPGSKPARKKTGDRPVSQAADLPQAVRALGRISEGLRLAQDAFAEAQLRLPTVEEYEPLAGPLREFARVSPALVEALRDVIQATRPLAALAVPLTAAVERLAAVVPGDREEPASSGGMCRHEEALRHVVDAQEAVLESLADLPRDSDYAPVAAQLRELATVSPSLMEWLNEVPKLAAPLSASVEALRRAAEALKTARELLTGD